LLNINICIHLFYVCICAYYNMYLLWCFLWVFIYILLFFDANFFNKKK
jgi:hypothetical protein